MLMKLEKETLFLVPLQKDKEGEFKKRIHMDDAVLSLQREKVKRRIHALFGMISKSRILNSIGVKAEKEHLTALSMIKKF